MAWCQATINKELELDQQKHILHGYNTSQKTGEVVSVHGFTIMKGKPITKCEDKNNKDVEELRSRVEFQNKAL